MAKGVAKKTIGRPPPWNLRQVSLQDLQYLVELAAGVSYQVLAQKYDLKDATLRKRMERLGSKLGGVVLTSGRGAAGSRITLEGADIAAAARDLIESMQRLQTTVTRRSGVTTVIVACFSVHVERVLADAVRDLPSNLSSLRVEFIEGRSSTQDLAMRDLFVRLEDEDVHLAVGGPRRRGFEGSRLYSDNIVALLPEGSPLWTQRVPDPDSGKRYLPIDALRDIPLLLPPKGFFSRKTIELALESAEVRPVVDTELASPAALYKLAAAGRGIPLFATDARLPRPPSDGPFPPLRNASGENVRIQVYMHWEAELENRSAAAWSFKDYLLKYVKATHLQRPRHPSELADGR